jgi:uncharacterized membrane protein
MSVTMIDVAIYILSMILIAGYHVFLRVRIRRDSAYTIQSINNMARSAWVDNIMSDRSNALLAVQTLRNSTMAATFLASTAILMCVGVLNLMEKDEAKNGLFNYLHGSGLHSSLITNAGFQNEKLLILLITFIWAFFCFSMAVRMYNHVGYLINSRNPRVQFMPSTKYVSKLLNRSGKYYSYGMRAYYISIPMIFSLYDPYFMAIASIGVIILLYNMDRAPQHDLEGVAKVREQGEDSVPSK